MSAGSALRGTHAAIQAAGATTVAAGALLVQGTSGLRFFEQLCVPVESLARDEFELWAPESCPMCEAGIPLEISPAAGA